jgi:hypothetical protein
MSFANTGNLSATNVFVEDSIPKGTSFVSLGTGGADRTPPNGQIDSVYPGHSQEIHSYWQYDRIPAATGGYYVDLTVKVNSGQKDGAQICNRVYIRSNETQQTWSPEKICHIVKKTSTPVPETPHIPPVVVTPTTPVPVPETPPITPPVTPTTPTYGISLSKSAVYLKHNGSTPSTLLDANKTTAVAGDVIEYTIKVLNSGDAALADLPITDDVYDILEYADITDLGGGSIQGHQLVWSAGAIIPAHTTVTKTFQATVKTPVPATVANGTSFDLIMHNIFGTNAVDVHVQPPTAAKQLEQTSQQLPETGAGTSLFIVCVIAALLVFFYSRNRQLIHEVAILRVDHNPGV